MAVARIALADHLAVKHFQSGEQGSCAVAFVIMGHRAATALLQRQAGLCSIQRPDLTLFVHAKHDRVLWRIQVQSHHAETWDRTTA